MKYPLELVTWLDIVGNSGSWLDQNDIKNTQPCRCTTVGWVVYESPEYLVLCGSLSEPDGYGDTNAVPMGCVVSRVPLRWAVEAWAAIEGAVEVVTKSQKSSGTPPQSE